MFIRNRNDEEVASAMDCDISSLRDQETDVERRKEDPQWYVLI